MKTFRRRGLLVPALVGAVVLILGVLALVSPWESEPGNPILERALATAGDGPVLHVIARERIAAGQRYDIETGRTREATTVYESWVDPERGRVHAIERSGGEVVSDGIVSMGGFGPAQTTATLAADYRRKLEEGEWRIARTGTIVGRKVHWLVSRAGDAGLPPYEAAVDAETYRLLRIRTIARYFQTTRDFELLEAMDRDEADFTARFGAPTAVRQVRSEGRSVAEREATRALRGAQWAGGRVDGLTLSDIRVADWRATLRPDGEVRGAILTVAYGERLGTIIDPAVGTPEGIEIVQAADDDAARWFLRPTPPESAPPPLGTFDLSAESSPSGQFLVASLRRPGVWLLVRAPSRRLLFEAVRSLRPIS